jgi:hypothetical protein
MSPAKRFKAPRRAVLAGSSIPSLPRAVLNYPGLLAQPNALLRPSLLAASYVARARRKSSTAARTSTMSPSRPASIECLKCYARHAPWNRQGTRYPEDGGRSIARGHEPKSLSQRRTAPIDIVGVGTERRLVHSSRPERGLRGRRPQEADERLTRVSRGGIAHHGCSIGDIALQL